MLSIDPNEIPTAKLHSYLLNAVAPRPIAFASTVDKNGAPIYLLLVFLMYLVLILQY